MGRRKEFEPAEALDEAMDLFWRRGYEAVAMQDLVDCLGVNRQSLYDTFGDKHELFLATLDRYFDVSVREQFKILDEPGSGLGAIRRFFESLVMRTGTDTAKQGCMIVNSAVELALHDEDTRSRVAAVFSWIEETFRKPLIRAQEIGELDERHDPRALARFFTCFMVGRNVLAKAGANRKSMQDAVEVALSVLE